MSGGNMAVTADRLASDQVPSCHHEWSASRARNWPATARLKALRGCCHPQMLSRWQPSMEGCREAYTWQAAADILQNCKSTPFALLQPQKLQPLLQMPHSPSAAGASFCKLRGARMNCCVPLSANAHLTPQHKLHIDAGNQGFLGDQ